MSQNKDAEKIKYSDVVGVQVKNPDGSSEFVPYNVAKSSGLVSSGEDLATMQGDRYAFKDFSGAYTADFTKSYPGTSIKMDSNGKITVTIPEEWQEDEIVKKYTDNYMLNAISSNYKTEKDTKYQDPFDETKQVTTEEWIEKMDEALKFRIDALNATGPTKANAISAFGGTNEKNKVINALTPEDVIVMSASFDKDDSWVPIPAYMLLAYPQLKGLETFKNGFVQKKDFLDNFYNIKEGKITEANAEGISSTPEKMLSEVEDMTPEEVAKTVAFGNFISGVDPERSNWSKFWQAGSALGEGFYTGFYDWFVGTSDLVSNVISLSFITGNSIDTRDFWNGMIGNIASGFTTTDRMDLNQLAEYGNQKNDGSFDVSEYFGAEMQRMGRTNKDALSKAQSGYMQGRLAGSAVDLMVSLVAVGEGTKYLSEKITTKITEKGGKAIGTNLAKEAVSGAKETGLVSETAYSEFQAGVELQNQAIAKVGLGSAKYRLFFNQTLSEALSTFSKGVGGATAMLQTMHPTQIANLVNAASRVATTATYANTAVNVLGNMVIASVLSNKELTTKVLSSEATSDEAKSWILQVMWDTAVLTGVSYVSGLASDKFSRWLEDTPKGRVLREATQKASQKVTGFTQKISHPWLSFMQWYLNNKSIATKVSNATASSTEALREAILANEARAYGATLSTVPGSYGTQLVEQALATSGAERGVTLAETLQNLERAGVVLDPSTLKLSEFEAWQAENVALQNALTNWGDVQSNLSQVIHEFTNPDIQPVISQQMSEINDANTALLREEQKAGLISKNEILFNKGLKKADDEWYLYAMHSPELSRYIVRKYELSVITNEATNILGITNLKDYQPYLDAKKRLEDATKAVPERLRIIADTQYVPALKKAEHNIIDVMVDAGVYPRAFVNSIRMKGKYGTDGGDWLRLVAKRDLPKGAYNPFSKMVKQDNTLSLNRFRILEDDQITWPGNGLSELINEYSIARAEKTLVKTGKTATGKTTEIVISGEQTSAADKMKEYKTEFESAVKQGFKSFTEDVEGTLSIGKKRTAEQKTFLKEVATTGGVETIDIDSLRAVMREKNLPMADDIVDQESLDKFLAESTPEARKLLLDTVGQKPYDIVTSDYSEKISSKTLEKRQKIAALDNEIKTFTEFADAYIAGINYGKMDTSTLSGEMKANMQKFIRSKVEAGKEAAAELGYKGKPEKFDAWRERKLASLNKKRDALISKVLDERGTKRPTIKFEGSLYKAEDVPTKYIGKRSERQKISDEILGSWNDPNSNGAAQRWLVDEDISAKSEIREAIETNPKLRSATLSTMYDNSGSDLSYEEWLDTPMTLTRQQKIDSLRPEDAFLSFSMNKNWTGTNDPDPDGSVLTGDIVTLQVKPRDTLGQIPQNIDNEGEAEVLVPREVYATAMTNYDTAMASDEMKRFEQTIKDMEAEIVERSPKEDAQEIIPELSYKERKDLAESVVRNNRNDYMLLYRVQGGKPDKWRPNNRGKKGKFEGKVGEYKGYVWLTSDADWAEGPQRASAGVERPGISGGGEKVTNENIVVLPVKKADIKNLSREGEAAAMRALEDGQKIVQSRGNSVEHGTEFILNGERNPEIFKEGMDLMLKEYNKQFDSRINKRAIDRIRRDIDVSRENIGLVIDEALRTEQYNNLLNLKQKDVIKYEALTNKVDRANAVSNDAIRQSQEIQVAADQFRQNIKDFENTTLFTDRFSYMAAKPADKGSLQAFVEENKLELPDDKRPLKAKVKHALWEKLQRGEELPKIKGITKKNLQPIINSVQGWTNRVLTTEPGSSINGDAKGQIKARKKEFYKMLDGTDLFKNVSSINPLKYELDEEVLYSDIDDAIDGMMELIAKDEKANLAVEGAAGYQKHQITPARFEFTVLSQILSSEGKKIYKDNIIALAHKIVDNLIPQGQIIIKGNQTQLYNKVRTAIEDRLESRFAVARAQLESAGEKAEDKTVTELLEEYRKDIEGAESDPLVIKTMDDNGEIVYEKVSPALANIYNARPTYTPMSSPIQILHNLAVLKKINTTDINPRSFIKQSFSDPAMAFATVGALPGTLQAFRDEIAAQFSPALLRAIEKDNPLRYSAIQQIAARENISMEEAFAKNSEALAKTQVPFTLLNSELLRQANVSKFGNKGALDLTRKSLNEKINAGLRRVSNVLGTPQNVRETYTRLYAGEKAYYNALKKGYNQEQAESFREYALNTATTNFRQKHTVFNSLRSTVPYLTSGISGAKSFWKMFELDPVGVSSRIMTGFIIPIIYFTGEIFSDDNLRQKYEDLAEYEKENHIIIPAGGELFLIPVGEEMGQYTNIVMHAVETIHGENKYDFWNLMLNDLVDFLPGADLTGFTDPEMWEPLSGETPNFLEVTENGIAKVLSSTMPPVFQSIYMASTGRDLYTGKTIDTNYVTIDEEGNASIMSSSTSQFAKALANVVGGDARVIEKVVSGSMGTVALHVLDTLTSAVQFVGSKGQEGSLATGIEKALSDLSAPFTAHGYDSLEKRWNSAASSLYREKEKIEKDDTYIKYNQEISSEKDPKKRQNLINKRNGLLTNYQNKVEALVKGYRNAGGSLDKWKFSKVVSLLTFEDAIRANRQFMEINTNYGDAYKQAMQTLYNMGVTNPSGVSSLGYIYTDNNGNPQVKMWTPSQIQIIQNTFYEQGNIHTARIKAIIDDGTENSLKRQKEAESRAEDPYWNKAKMSSSDYDAIDELRKAYNAKVVLALTDYIDTYGAANVLSNDAVMDYLNDIIRVPTSYEKVKGRFVSSDNGKLNKQTGFAESYIKTIFGVK